MKKNIFSIALLLSFLLLFNFNGYGQLSQFLIGTQINDNTRTKKDGGNYPDPIAFDDQTPIYCDSLIKYGINAISGGNISILPGNDSTHLKIYDKALSAGLNVMPQSKYYNKYPDRGGVIGFTIWDELSFLPKFTPESIFNAATDDNNKLKSQQNLLRHINLFPEVHESFVQSDYSYRNYLQHFINTFQPNVLSFDDYPILFRNGCPKLFRDNKHVYSPSFMNLYNFGSKSTENSIPYFYILSNLRSYIDNSENGVPGAPAWNTSTPTTPAEARYCIFSPLAYGAKGINYWPGFEWSLKTNFTGDTVFSDIVHWGDGVSKKEYIKIHKMLNENSQLLLNMNFASAYHYSMAPTTRPTSTGNDTIQKFCRWENLANDEYAKFIFGANATNPIINIKTEYYITFLTDKEHNIYFWVVNKDTMNDGFFGLNLDQKNVAGLIQLMQTNTLSFNTQNGFFNNSNYFLGNKSCLIQAGEGKLFKVVKKDSSKRIKTVLTNRTFSVSPDDQATTFKYTTFPLVTADSICINGSKFKSGSISSYMAHNIILGKGTKFDQGSQVHIKKYTNSNTTPDAPTQVKAFKGNNDVIENKIAKVETVMRLYPNPNNGNFRITMDLAENETTQITIYNNMGNAVKKIEANTQETKISLENEPTGVYFVQYTLKDKIYNHKLIKIE